MPIAMTGITEKKWKEIDFRNDEKIMIAAMITTSTVNKRVEKDNGEWSKWKKKIPVHIFLAEYKAWKDNF